MPKIEKISVAEFAKAKNAKTIDPLPAKGSNQRGPTCGFYALGFVMQYWFERQSTKGDVSGLTKPLPPRTKPSPGPLPMTRDEKIDKDIAALAENFKSLRHYGKFNKLTVYGSVFNAESMVKVARGQGAQYHGQYEGHVIHTSDPKDLVATVQRFLEEKCPLIIPFGVGKDGDPLTEEAGAHAHWAVIVGSYTVSGEGDYFIHYHWGEYRYAKALLFAESNHSLTSNRFVQFQKLEVKKQDGTVFRREYVGPSSSNALTGVAGEFGHRYLGEPQSNLEFNNPSVLNEKQIEAFGARMGEHGFDSKDLVNAGLIKNLVAVYPASLRDKMMAV